MSEVIAVMNQKGGCGKTTTVVNTATSLAVMGKSVLVVDMDPQANATTSFGIDKTKIENTVYDAIIGDINVKKATIPTFIKNLFIIPSNISLSGAGMELSKRENYHIVLKDTLKDDFDDFWNQNVLKEENSIIDKNVIIDCLNNFPKKDSSLFFRKK